MPVYEYECGTCSGRFEVLQKFSDPEVSVCKLCNASPVIKLLSPTAFVLKGSGWYATDYPSENRKKAMESEKPKADSGTSDSVKTPTAGCSSGTCASGSCPSKS